MSEQSQEESSRQQSLQVSTDNMSYPQSAPAATVVAAAVVPPPPPPPEADDLLDFASEDGTMKMSTPPPPPPPRRHAKKELPRVLDARKAAVFKSDSFAETGSGTTTSTTTSATTRSASNNKSPGLCVALPEDMICKITSFLDASSLLQVRCCSKQLQELATRNEAGWEGLCSRLWATKVHVTKPPLTNDDDDDDNIDNGTPIVTAYYYMKAYRESTADARDRHYITLEELCYDPETRTGTVWSFRFKESAGTDWTAADPWWNSLPSRKMVFLRDGSIKQYIATNGSDEQISSNNNDNNNATTNQQIELRRPNFGTNGQRDVNIDHGGQRDNPPQEEEEEANAQRQPPAGRLVQPPLTMSWRILLRPMDLPERPFGSYLRFTVGGRDVPTYSVRRSPTGNWGFVMESCWGVYTSFEMPPRRRPQQLRRRLRRTETGARWVEVWDDGQETLSTAPFEATRRRASLQQIQQQQHLDDSELLDDASLIITNEIQWREAFLYNVGARTLPEGNNAVDDFDRAFIRGVGDDL